VGVNIDVCCVVWVWNFLATADDLDAPQLEWLIPFHVTSVAWNNDLFMTCSPLSNVFVFIDFVNQIAIFPLRNYDYGIHPYARGEFDQRCQSIAG